MQVKILIALLATVLVVVVGYFALDSRRDAEHARPDSEAGVAERAGDAAPEPDAAEGPRFELVRVEPSGELVAAGRAAAQVNVELVSADVVVGSAASNASGEWAMVLGQPLGVGSHNLALRAREEGEETPVYGDQVAVVISEDGETPLVAVTPEGEPSRVVQRPGDDEPAEDEPAAGEALAALDRPTDGQGATGQAPQGRDDPAATPAPEDEGTDPRAESDASADRDEAPNPAAPSPAGRDEPGAGARDAAADTAADDQRSTGQAPAVAQDEARDEAATDARGAAPAAGDTAAGPTAEDDDAPTAFGGEETAAAADDGGADMPAASDDAAAPAGAAEDSAAASQTADADTRPEDGAATGDEAAREERQTAALGTSEPATTQPDRSDPVVRDDTRPGGKGDRSDRPAARDGAAPAPGGQAEKAERAEMAEKGAPGPEGAGNAASSGQSGRGAGQAASATEAAAGGAPAGPVAKPTGEISIETVEVADPGQLMLSGQGEAGQPVRVYVNNEPLAEVTADADGRWTVTAAQALPPGSYEVRADSVDASGDVTARSAVEFDRVQVAFEGQGGDVTATGSGAGATGEGDATGQAGDASVVMINRGDNLWRIARKLYGEGTRYTVIYDANRSQIRDPSLIYPGQVFTIPRGVEDAGADPRG